MAQSPKAVDIPHSIGSNLVTEVYICGKKERERKGEGEQKRGRGIAIYAKIYKSSVGQLDIAICICMYYT